MVQLCEETHVNGFLRVVGHGRLQTETGVRNRPIDIGCFVHGLHLHHFAHGEKHTSRVGFEAKLMPVAHQLGESHREGAVLPMVGKGVGSTVISAFPALRAGVIASKHVAHEVFR